MRGEGAAPCRGEGDCERHLVVGRRQIFGAALESVTRWIGQGDGFEFRRDRADVLQCSNSGGRAANFDGTEVQSFRWRQRQRGARHHRRKRDGQALVPEKTLDAQVQLAFVRTGCRRTAGQAQGVGCGGKTLAFDSNRDFDLVVFEVLQPDLRQRLCADLDRAEVDCARVYGKRLGVEGSG